jgi:hypothetical protein
MAAGETDYALSLTTGALQNHTIFFNKCKENLRFPVVDFP